MKITEVRVILTCPTRNHLFVKVLTDAGIYGVGEGTLNGSEPIVAAAVQHAAELLIGKDPLRTEDLWQLVYNWSFWRGGAIYMTALAALDMALWDIKGKVANMPVYQLLGGRSREGILTYGHADGGSKEEVLEGVLAFQERGYKVVRAQIRGYGGHGNIGHEAPSRPGLPGTTIWHPPKYLAETPPLFEFLRAKLGMEAELLHDIHGMLTPIEAAWLAKQLEPYRLFFLEDILPIEHFESFRLVRDASKTSLAIGELFTGRWDCLRLFQEQLIDFIRIKPIHVGGITEARKILTMAEPYGIRSACHGAADVGPIGQAASLHLQLAIPNFGIQEWHDFHSPEYAPLREVVGQPCRWAAGYAQPHEAPGLGMDIDEAAAARYPYQKAWMPLIRRPDGTVHHF